MKNEKMLKALNLIDDKYIEEAEPQRTRKRTKFIKIGALAACLCLMITGLNLWLFLPFSDTGDDLTPYENNTYYPIIEKLSAFKYTPPSDKNNFDKYFGDISLDYGPSGAEGDKIENSGENVPTDDGLNGNAPESGTDIEGKYEETTDNQVEGVIEGDLIKRSDKYIYYLTNEWIYVYSIEKEESVRVTTYHLPLEKGTYSHAYISEMYLSEDCRTLTVIVPGYSKINGAITDIISIDVSDVNNIAKKGSVRILGSYLSSRVTNGKLLFMHEFQTAHKPDYSDESTFIPQIDTGDGFESIPPENIVYPDVLSSAYYTVVSSFDEKTLSLDSTYAFLSYSTNVYVSKDNVYVSRTYSKTEKIDEKKESSTNIETHKTTTMSDISRLAYNGGSFEYCGVVSIKGSIKNQYSLDEYEGILRVVTTTRENTYENRETTTKNGNNILTDALIGWGINEHISASLYCISLETMSVISSVNDFAPEGETVESVRFDKDKAYVCTAVVITLTDPVFFFDLSDVNNITYTDTGKIDGFSSSLINLGEGYLLGIGKGDGFESVKVEVYTERDGKVVSVAKYVIPAGSYSTDYKSYFIDRESNLFGFGASVYTYEYNTSGHTSRYILLLFDGYNLVEILNVPLGQDNDTKRAVYIDGYFYMLGNNSFRVVYIG